MIKSVPILFAMVALPLLVGGCEASTAAVTGPVESNSSPVAPLARVLFRNVGGHVVVPVSVNGSRNLDMVLDTGMSAPIVMLLHRELQDEVGLGGGEPTLIGGAGGGQPKQGKVFSGVRVSIGGFEQPDQTVIVMDESRKDSTWTMDGVIGKSIFDRYLVEIDFERSVLFLHEPAASDRFSMASLPLSLRMGIPTVEGRIEAGGGKEIPIGLVLDLGARHALSLNVDAEKGILPPEKTITGVIGKGILGEIEGRIGRTRGLRLGPFEFRDVITSFTTRQTGTTCSAEGLPAEGNLGVEVLSRFRVVVDYPHQRLLLSPNARYARPFEYNMAGLSLEQQQDGSYLVRSVLADSPGTDSGIRRGDRIVGIAGRDSGHYSYTEGSDRFRRNGRSLKVSVERNGERFERTLALRRLI